MARLATVSGVILFALSLKKLNGHFVTSTTRKLAEPESTVAVDVDASVLNTATETAGRPPKRTSAWNFPFAFVTTMAGDHMPAFCARWPDGSFSIVDADDETHALIQLDELGDEPAQLWQLQSCLLDFELTDSGTFRIREFGEQTGSEIMERAYPVLSKALEDQAFAEHALEDQSESVEYGSEATDVLRGAVDAERKRLRDFQRTSATTEHGKKIQRELGGSGAYIDAIVEQSASKRLKRYKPAKNIKPS